MSFVPSKGSSPRAWLVMAAALLWLACNEVPQGGQEGLRGQGLESQALQTLAGSRWTSTAPMTERRRDHTATLLRDGKVLVVGGKNTGNLAYTSAESYDPDTGRWTVLNGRLNTARGYHTATLLRNGKVLVVGGADSSGASLSSAELYDPATDRWTLTGSLAQARDSHTATLLQSGKVLVVGGSANGSVLQNVELYDPDSGTWTSPTENDKRLREPRKHHTATLLQDGRVLVTGGITSASNSLPDGRSGTELYNPDTQTWTTVSAMHLGRFRHTATLLPDGRVLVIGGQFKETEGFISYCSSRGTAEVYTPNNGNGSWAYAADLGWGRQDHTAVLLASGKVLMAGGRDLTWNSSSNCFERMSFDAKAYSPNAWTGAGNPSSTRVSPTATLLPNGKVLIAGGLAGGGAAHNSAELYEPGEEQWTASTALSPSPIDASATLLPDGEVLVAGGQGPQGAALDNSSTYDPDAGSFTATGSLNEARSRHTATLLVTGKVLVMGGQGTSNALLNSAELYDPATRQWTRLPDTTPPVLEHRSLHTATLLPGGTVLLAGGEGLSGVLGSAQVYDPDHQESTPTGLMQSPRSLHTATPLPGGKVLVVGGKGPDGTALDSGEVYDPAIRQWALLPSSLAEGRWHHTTTLLPGGKVLIVGGRNSDGALDSVELYDVVRGRWADSSSLNQARFGHTTTLLPSGRVLVAGGYGASGERLQSAELYDPATRQWTYTVDMATARSGHTVAFLPSGKVFVFGGGTGASAEVYDDLSVCPQCRPVINPIPAPQAPGALLTLTGSHLSGVSEASNGTSQSSPTNFPTLHLRAVEGGTPLRLEPQLPSSDSVLQVQLPTLPDGYYILSVTAHAASGSTMLLVDGASLAAPTLTEPAAGSFVNSTRPTFRGRAAPERMVTVFLDGSLAGTTPANASGAWAFRPATELTQARHQVFATAADPRGDVSPSTQTVTFTVDTQAPGAPLVNAPGALVDIKRPVIAGSAEPGSTVTVSLDGTVTGSPLADALGNWSLTPAEDLDEGAHAVTATATDAAGNTSPSSAPLLFTVDTVAPDAPEVGAPGAFVNTRTPLIGGTAEAGSTVTVREAETVLGTTTVSASGGWALPPGSVLAEGPHEITATATDAVGNVSASSEVHIFTVDTVKPEPPRLSTPGPFVNTLKPIIAGTAEPRSSVTVWLNTTGPRRTAESLGTVIANSSGDWALIPATELQEGVDYEVGATATDAAGNTSDGSSSRSFMADITAPLPPVLRTPGNFINKRSPIFEGTAEAFSKVTIVVGSTEVGSLRADADGHWSITPPQDLAEGAHPLEVTATDKAGNKSAPASARGFTVDTVSPASPKVSGPAAFVNIPDPVIHGTTELGSAVSVWMNGLEAGAATVDEEGNWSYRPQALLESLYEVTVIATDAAGNHSIPSFAYSFTVDLTPPLQPVVNGPAAFVNVQDPVIRGTAETGSTVKVWLDGVEVGPVTADTAKTWLYNPTQPLSSGSHHVTVTATDAAGNESPTSQDHRFIVDLEPPSPPTVSAPGAFVSTPQPVIAGTAEPGSTVVVQVDGKKIGEATTDESGNWSLTPLIQFEAGQHTLSAIAQDLALNGSEPSDTQTFLVRESHYGWGCSSSSAFPVTWALLVLVGALGRRRLRVP